MSERVYKLLNGSELLVSEEVIGVRLKPDSMPLTTDGDGVIDDVLDLLDKTVYERDLLRKKYEEKNSRHTKAIRLLMQVTDILSMGMTPDRAGAALKEIYKWLHENNPVGQEGEGNQDA